jgi:hypothetical protein
MSHKAFWAEAEIGCVRIGKRGVCRERNDAGILENLITLAVGRLITHRAAERAQVDEPVLVVLRP